jgi:hypothetical protein
MIGRSIPAEYRLVKRDNEILLQGGFHFVNQETGENKIEWRDMPTMTETVKDQLEESPTNDQIAQVMLLHGTGEQRKEALEYIGIPTLKNEIISNKGNRYLFIGYDRDSYAIVQSFQRPSMLSTWMLRDSDGDVELLTIEECDYELKYILIPQGS